MRPPLVIFKILSLSNVTYKVTSDISDSSFKPCIWLFCRSIFLTLVRRRKAFPGNTVKLLLRKQICCRRFKPIKASLWMPLISLSWSSLERSRSRFTDRIYIFSGTFFINRSNVNGWNVLTIFDRFSSYIENR